MCKLCKTDRNGGLSRGEKNVIVEFFLPFSWTTYRMCLMEMTKSFLISCSRSVEATGSTERPLEESIHKRIAINRGTIIPLEDILQLEKGNLWLFSVILELFLTGIDSLPKTLQYHSWSSLINPTIILHLSPGPLL